MSWAMDEEVRTSGPEPCQDIVRKLDPLFAEPEPVVQTVKESTEVVPFIPGQEHMKVYLRVRPLSEVEKEKKEDQVIVPWSSIINCGFFFTTEDTAEQSRINDIKTVMV